MIREFSVPTHERYQLIDITEQIREAVKGSGVEEGIVLVFTPHSTAAIVLTENESGLKKDWLAMLEKLVSGIDFLHNQIDNNADSHILSGLIGQGKTLAVENRDLILGTWQQIFLVELDGPRKRRTVIIKIMK